MNAEIATEGETMIKPRIVFGAVCFLVVANVGCDLESMVRGGPAIQGSGVRAEETRDVVDFDAVEIRGSMDLVVAKGESWICRVSGDDNIVPLIRTRVIGGRLVVDSEENYAAKERLRVDLQMPALTAAALHGSGEIRIPEVTGESLDLTINGSGNVTGQGTIGRLAATVNGSGDVRLRELQADRVTVTINGSGSAEVWAEEALKARINGSGQIRYAGAPGELSTAINGSGSVDRR